jgi:signal transduction histidine kinase
MEHRVAESVQGQPSRAASKITSGDTTGVITVRQNGCLVYYTPAAAKWLSGPEPLRLGDAWYAGLAEPTRLRMHHEWMMHLLEGQDINLQSASPLTYFFESNDSTRQVVIEFAAPLGDIAHQDLLIGTVRVTYLEPNTRTGRSGSMPSENKAAPKIDQVEIPPAGDTSATGGLGPPVSAAQKPAVAKEPNSEVLAIQAKLLRTIGHEMQQPIYAIQNFVFAALQHLKMGQSEKVGEMLAKVERQILRASEFGDRLRQFASQTRQNARSTNLHQVIESSCELMQIFANDAHATVRLSLRATETMVVCDPVQIHQVLLNLVRNSADSLAKAEPQNRSLSIETENDDEMILIRVADSGPGIAEDDRERIFDHLFSTKESGLGLGLPYCQSVLTAHGGTLTLAENRAGRVVFEIRLPTAE